MQRIHLLAVEGRASTFRRLFEAAAAAGVRIGWLELAPPGGEPEELVEAATQGALRAVRAGEGRTVAVKSLRGEARLRDLLREHFSGCSLVLVRGAEEGIPRLEPEGEGWRVLSGRGELHRTTGDLVVSLARPRPWG